MNEASPAEFRFGLFCNTTTDASILSERAPSGRGLPEGSLQPYWEPDSSYLFSVGMVLEERALLAQGAASGVFPPDEVASWLRDDDPRIQLLQKLAADREDVLPPFLTSEELLSHQTDRGASEFRSTLFFRDDERAFQLDRYHSTLVFGTDDEWAELINQAARERDEIFSARAGAPELNVLSNIFDSVMVCANLLSYLGGEPQGNLSPWHVAVPGLDSDARRVDLNAIAGARTEAAAKTLRSTFEAFGINLEEEAPFKGPLSALRAALLFRYVEIALTPASTTMEIFTGASEVAQAVTSLQMFSAVVNAGPEMSWGAAAWRLAPSDSRSLTRQREAVDWVLATLRQLQEEGLQGEEIKAQFV
jgi:hypothetical protein